MGVDPAQGSTSPTDAAPRTAEWRRRVFVAGAAFVLLGALALLSNGVARERSELPARTEPLPAPAPRPAASHAMDADREALRERLGALVERLDALVQRDVALRKRLEVLEKQLAQRPSAAPTASPSRAVSVPTDLEPLYERLSTIETNLEREGAARIQSQEDLLARVHQLESTRDAGTTERLAAQKAAEERVFNVEERIHAAETQIVELEKRLSTRLEALEAR